MWADPLAATGATPACTAGLNVAGSMPALQSVRGVLPVGGHSAWEALTRSNILRHDMAVGVVVSAICAGSAYALFRVRDVH